MPTVEGTDNDGRYTARTATGTADFTDVNTRWEEIGAYVTRVAEFVGGRYIPLEYHRSADPEAARVTHRAAVRRHPKKGTTRTLPREVRDGRCTRCGTPVDAEPAHATDCRP